jgi:hypothetical protein
VRKQLPAEPIAREAAIEIRSVLARGLPRIGQVGKHMGTAGVQQGAQKRRRSKRAGARHAGQAAQTRAAHQPMQDRFGLVVGRVAKGHESSPLGAGDSLQENSPRLACARLGSRSVFVGPSDSARQSESIGQRRDERGVGRRRGPAPAMIQVGNDEPVRAG